MQIRPGGALHIHYIHIYAVDHCINITLTYYFDGPIGVSVGITISFLSPLVSIQILIRSFNAINALGVQNANMNRFAMMANAMSD